MSITELIIAVMLAGAVLSFSCFAIVFGYGKWVMIYLIILTALCYQAWRVGTNEHTH